MRAYLTGTCQIVKHPGVGKATEVGTRVAERDSRAAGQVAEHSLLNGRKKAQLHVTGAGKEMRWARGD